MKRFIIIALALVLNSCATVSMDKQGDDVKWKSTTLFKDISEVDAQAMGPDGTFTFGLGQSVNGMTPAQTSAMLCVFNPAFCK